jgi:hypothetical protein
MTTQSARSRDEMGSANRLDGPAQRPLTRSPREIKEYLGADSKKRIPLMLETCMNEVVKNADKLEQNCEAARVRASSCLLSHPPKLNTTTIVVSTSTGSPFSMVGRYRHSRTASIAALISNGGPEM